MFQQIINRLQKEKFLITPIAIIINPFYIIRNGLFKAISQLAPTLTGDILDFGCGSKPYESLFTHAKSYIGVDIEGAGHDHKNSKIDFFYDGKKLPFPDAEFDTVLCFEVLEHVFNPEEVLSEINRVLKSNGKLLLSVPFAWDEHEVPYDFARYTSYGISSILKKSNFEIVLLTKTTTYFLAISQLFIAYFYQHVLPKNRILCRLLQVLILFPLTVIFLTLNLLLPKRYEYFCNSVVLAKKCAPSKTCHDSPLKKHMLP